MKKTIILALILTGFLVFLAPNLPKVSAITEEELQAQIQQLLQIIQQLQQQLNTLTSGRPQPSSGLYCFSITLKYGMTSPEVKNLQIVLGVKPATGYFGDLTLAAVKHFQEKHNIEVTGEVGPQTREVLNSLYCAPSPSQCGWCGQDCIRKTPTMNCPDVMPPLEVECKEVNGVCTKIPLIPPTKYSCVTTLGTISANTYSTCVPNTNGTFNSLAECQEVCGIRPWLKIISPNGGEKFTINEIVPIYFETNLTDKQTSGITFQLYKQTTDSFSKMYVQDIAKEVNTGSPYRWTIPATIKPGNYYIYATAVNLRDVSVKEISDFSDNAFSIVATSTCTDSDGGDNIYVKGYRKDWQDLVEWDYCILNPFIYPDGSVVSDQEKKVTECAGNNCYLIEYHCSNITGDAHKGYQCPSGYTCQDGACKQGTSNINTCMASYAGGGLNIGILTKDQCKEKAQTTKSDLRYTVCDNIAISDSQMIYIKWGSEIIDQFSAECNSFTMHTVCDSSGKCMLVHGTGMNQCAANSDCAVIPCTDSDGGKNIYVKGTLMFGFLGGSHGQTFIDSCIDTNTVKEYECSQPDVNTYTVESYSLTCPSGYTCQDGACKLSSTPLSVDLKVNNSDGPITVLFNSILNVSWNSTGATICIPLGPFMPLVKGGIWAPSNYSSFPLSGTEQIYAQHQGFPQDTVLDIGIICSKPGYSDVYDHVVVNLTSVPNSPTCTDSDGGWNIYTKGITYINNTAVCVDRCATASDPQPDQLFECFCGDKKGSGGGQGSGWIVCPSGYTCQDGACKQNATNTCTASYAGGELVIGTNLTRTECQTKAQNTQADLRYEVCSNIVKGASETIYIKWGSEIISQLQAQCNTFCTDTDGYNIYFKGSVNYKGQTYTDYCLSNNTVAEYFCENNQMKSTSAGCPSGYTCQDGACKQSANSTSYLDSLKTQLPQLSDLIKKLSAALVQLGQKSQ